MSYKDRQFDFIFDAAMCELYRWLFERDTDCCYSDAEMAETAFQLAMELTDKYEKLLDDGEFPDFYEMVEDFKLTYLIRKKYDIWG